MRRLAALMAALATLAIAAALYTAPRRPPEARTAAQPIPRIVHTRASTIAARELVRAELRRVGVHSPKRT